MKQSSYELRFSRGVLCLLSAIVALGLASCINPSELRNPHIGELPHWSPEPSFPANASVTSFGCDWSGDCHAVALVMPRDRTQEIISFNVFGVHSQLLSWSYATPFTLITCTAAKVCAGVLVLKPDSDPIEFTSDGGRSWRRSLVAGGPVAIQALQCPSTTQCLVLADRKTAGDGVREVAYSTLDRGKSWTESSINVQQLFADLSCSSTVDCYAYEPSGGVTSIYWTGNMGESWKPVMMSSRLGDLDFVTCLRNSSCIAGFARQPGHSKYSHALWLDNGKAVAVHPTPLGEEQVLGSCVSQQECTLFGLDGGQRAERGNSAICNKGRCYGPIAGTVATTSDGGLRWSRVTEPRRGLEVGILCPSTTWCAGLERVSNWSRNVLNRLLVP